MSFKSYMKNGKDDMIEKKGAPNDKHNIKDRKTMELPKIDQERINLLGLLKNMKWKNHTHHRAESPSTDKPETSETQIVTRQIVSHELMGKRNHTDSVKAHLLKNHVINRKLPETKPSIGKPKINAPKLQTHRIAPPQLPTKKFTKSQNNAAMTKEQLEFSKRNSKKLPTLNISAKNANAKMNGLIGFKVQLQNQELIDIQNEIAKIQIQEKPKLTELKPAFQSEDQELSNTLNEIAQVQAKLEFLKNNPDYIPELNENEQKPTKTKPPAQKLQSQSQELTEIQTEIAKVTAQLEFLNNNSDYIPETNVCISKAPKDNKPKMLKSNKSKENLKNTVTNLKSKQITKSPATKQSNVPKKSKIGSLPGIEHEEFADYPKRLNKKVQQKEYKVGANTPDTQKIAEAKNNVAEIKSQLEILEDNQEESFEDYWQRMLKCKRKIKLNILETIKEEESEVFEDGCEEQEDVTEVEEIIERKINQEKLEVAKEEEECEKLKEEKCETLDEKKFKSTNEEICEEDNEEERKDVDEETQNVIEEIREDNENIEFCTAVSKNKNKNEHENYNPQTFDGKIPGQKKIQLLDILKKITWGKTVNPNESVELEVQLAGSTDNEEIVESSEIQSDTKFDDLETQPFGTSVVVLESVSSKASKEDIFTSFFKNKSLHEEEMISESEKSQTLQQELLENCSVATSKTEEVYTKSTSENEPEKFRTSEDVSFSSFSEDKLLIKPKHRIQNKPREAVSDQSNSLSGTKKESKKSVLVDNTLKDLQRLPDTMESNFKQNNEDETTSEGLKGQSSSIKCNMETDKKTVELSNAAPCETASTMELEYSENFESDISDKPTKPNSMHTKVCDLTSDSCTEQEESLKIESVYMSEDSSKRSKHSLICHLYKVKIRIKSISWRGTGNMEAVTLSFYNPLTEEKAAVQRKFVLPYFYTADFYCYVSYISPPNMLDSSLGCYPPVILISKRKKSVVELARGVLNLKKGQTNVPLTNNGKIIGDIIISAKILDYGPLRDKDESSINEIIEIIFKETKYKEIKISSPIDIVDKTLQKKKKHLIVEEFSSLGDNTSIDFPPDQLFKKKPFNYKRKTKSERTKQSRRYTSEESFSAISSISIQNDKIENQKSFINNCKDIQTHVQKENLGRRKSKSKMIQTESEMDCKYATTRLQCESKVTQTEATSERQQIISSGKNKQQHKKYEMKVTKLTQFSITDTSEENLLMNNPDFHAMKKYYHSELGKVDVMTSTSNPYFRPPTTERGVQTSKHLIKNYTTQTKQEKLLPLLSEKCTKLGNTTSKLQASLVIVDTIPSTRNDGKKLINKNILYEKVCESEKPHDEKSIDVKNSSKTVRLSKSNIQLESYFGQCVSAMPNKNLVTNLQFKLQHFVKNIKLELHILKYPDDNIQHHKKNSRESTDFDKLVNSFTSMIARNEERDFNTVYGELQKLQDIVYKFKIFSEEYLGKTEFRSKTKQIENVGNYVFQDEELKLIFKNPKMDQAPERSSHDDNYRQKPSRG